MNAKELLTKQTRDAFSGDDEMSLQAAIWQLTPEEAHWKPNDETGTIEAILHHLAWCKVWYAKQAFGPCELEDDLPAGDLVATISWLKRSHDHLVMCLTDLSLEDLKQPVPTRFHGESAAHLFWVLLMHDLCHGGQIQIVRREYKSRAGGSGVGA